MHLHFDFLFFSSLIAQKKVKGFEVKKGNAFTGLLLSYSNQKKENSKNSFENIVSSKDNQISIKTGGGYFVKDWLALGLGFNLSRSSTSKETKNATGPNSIENSSSNGFGFTPYLRNYIGLDRNHHFYLYTQTGLVFSMDNGSATLSTGSIETTTDIFKKNYGISFTPGLLAFVEKGFAFEVNVGVGGINYSIEKKKTPGQPEAVIKNTNVDLNINILKLNLGFAYYF